MEFNSLIEEDRRCLERDFSKEEILCAMASMEGDKTPMFIYNKYWDFLKVDFMRVVQEFQDNAFLNWRLNNTFITLNLKKEGEKSICDYCPISLLLGPIKLWQRISLCVSSC